MPAARSCSASDPGSDDAVRSAVPADIIEVAYNALGGQGGAPREPPPAVVPDRCGPGQGCVGREPGGDDTRDRRLHDRPRPGTDGSGEGRRRRPSRGPARASAWFRRRATIPGKIRSIRCRWVLGSLRVDHDDPDVEPPRSCAPEVHRLFLPHHEHCHLGTSGAGRSGDVLDVCVDAAQGAVVKADGDA